MNRNLLKTIIVLLLITNLTAGLWARGDAELPMKGPITVASKFDTEGALLGNVMLLVLEQGGFDVVDKTELGATDVVRKALETGEVDMYPEYTGNGNWFFMPNDYGDDWYDSQGALAAVRALDKAAFDMEWLQPAPANNTWAIAIRGDIARAEGLVTLSDFADYVNAGGEVRLAGSEEFVSRPDSLPAFQEAYGFKLKESQLLVLSSGNTALTEQAAARGTDGVNTAMAYGTDGPLAALGLVVLEDNLGVQLVYEPAPRVRSAVLGEYPEIADLLNPVFSSMDLVVLQTLNAKIAVEGISSRDVAETWLKSEGFID
ncbi:MAG: ABC transporter substrate-binding protein [Spirochaetaceae bacterium]|nr:ABC transporter substrate-binding protein [Spirochaetaceae bacterium]